MFCLSSSLQQAEHERDILRLKYRTLEDKWNALVGRINKKGGEAFLNGNTSGSLSPEDVKLAIRFCHPDKHHGNPDANRITQKLLAVRDKQ